MSICVKNLWRLWYWNKTTVLPNKLLMRSKVSLIHHHYIVWIQIISHNEHTSIGASGKNLTLSVTTRKCTPEAAAAPTRYLRVYRAHTAHIYSRDRDHSYCINSTIVVKLKRRLNWYITKINKKPCKNFAKHNLPT